MCASKGNSTGILSRNEQEARLNEIERLACMIDAIPEGPRRTLKMLHKHSDKGIFDKSREGITFKQAAGHYCPGSKSSIYRHLEYLAEYGFIKVENYVDPERGLSERCFIRGAEYFDHPLIFSMLRQFQLPAAGIYTLQHYEKNHWVAVTSPVCFPDAKKEHALSGC